MTSTARAATKRAPTRPRRRQGGSRLDRVVARGLRLLERPEAPYLVLLGGFMLAGSYLRLNGLGAQSLWFDEADVVMQAQGSAWSLLRNIGAAGQNGPLYTLFLHVWTALFGVSEVAVRLPSALASIATIPLIYAVGRALHGPKLGLYTAGVITVAPYQQWYAQEAKMYALVVCATLASTYLFLLALRTDRRALWIAYIIVTTLALYLHVTAVLVLAAQLAYFVFSAFTARGQRQRWRGWLALAALTVPYLPLALWEGRFMLGNTVTWHRPIDLLDFLRVLLTKFAVNRADAGAELRGRWLFAALAGFGALPLAWRHAPWSPPAFSPLRRALLLLLLLALPVTVFYLVTLARPLFSDRYLIVVTPALYLLVAGGILALERFVRPLGWLAIVAILTTVWTPLQTTSAASQAQAEKEDWRGAYQLIAEHLHPRDLIIVQPGYLYTTLDYYRLRQPEQSRLRQTPLLTLPAEYTDGTFEQRRLDLFLQEQTAGFERVWLVLSSDRPTLADADGCARSAPATSGSTSDRLAAIDPRDQVRDWYCYNARLISDRQFNGVWTGLYVYSQPFGAPYYPPAPGQANVSFDGRATLVGYSYDLYPDESAVRDVIPLVLRWTFPNAQVRLFDLRWRLLDERGVTVASGAEPIFGGKPLRRWEDQSKGRIWWDYHDLQLPSSVPNGQYQLMVEAVERDRSATPLPAQTAGQLLPGNAVTLGWITVQR